MAECDTAIVSTGRIVDLPEREMPRAASPGPFLTAMPKTLADKACRCLVTSW